MVTATVHDDIVAANEKMFAIRRSFFSFWWIFSINKLLTYVSKSDLYFSIWSITRYPKIVWPPRVPINIKIVGNTPGYPVELNHHNALTFSQHTAPGFPELGPATTAECKQCIKADDWGIISTFFLVDNQITPKHRYVIIAVVKYYHNLASTNLISLNSVSNTDKMDFFLFTVARGSQPLKLNK